MENKSHALAAGTFVLAVAALLIGLAVWLTRDSANYRLYELSTKDAVSGLQPQAAVRYKGVAVGKVVRIGFDPQVSGNVLIRIAVNEQAPVSDTTFAVLGYQGVTGLAHVLLDDAPTPYAPLPSGTSGLPRLPLKPSPFGRLADQAPDILMRVDEATRRINRILGDDNQRLLTEALGQIGQAAGQVAALARTLDGTVQQRLDPALASLPPLAGDARAALQSLQQAGQNVAALTGQLDRTLQRVNAEGGMMDQIDEGSRAFARAADQFNLATLPRIQRATDEVARAARLFGRAADSIGDNPQLFIYGSGRLPPGPGEPGFMAPLPAPAR
ncbi:MlaD family protein [Acidovorax lacteus]|uniref:MlaD family protein n=1 Tax=Acidovorax lacteus TaxID=1924988 RepID=A0ABP8LA40_9BURK